MLVAVKINQEWLRAEILFKLGNMSDTMAGLGLDFLVKLVDIGKVDVVNIRCMRILEKCFPTLPVQVVTFLTSHCPQPSPGNIVLQALQVKLLGVERHNEATKVILQQLCLGKVVVGHVIKREMDSVYLILYDTSLECDVNININVMLEKNLKELS